MATRGQFNTKNPTIKRILKEASEISTSPSPDYHAEPLETNLFEWHFTLRGPPAPSPYAGGIYHGRIVLPPQYPLRPPAFRFLTPTGRFEVNREICLSISGHHEETWQPAWGVRTALVAIRSFMDSDAKGQLGGIECSKEVRRRLAGESFGWKCGACGKMNAEIMQEMEGAAREKAEREGDGRKDAGDEVPAELRLAYREDLGKRSEEVEGQQEQKMDKGKQRVDDAGLATSASTSTPTSSSSLTSTAPNAASAAAPAAAAPPVNASAPVPRPTRTVPARPIPVQPITHQVPDRSIAWIDTCIYGVVAALIFMVLKKFA